MHSKTPTTRDRGRITAVLFVLTMLCGMATARAEEVTYIIPIRGTIERALLYVVRRGVAQARKEQAGAVVIVIDTHGGRVDSAEQIAKALHDISVPTYAFVEKDAFSAGAILALAADRIYMAPASRIGAVVPLVMSPLGGVQEVPESVEEKQLSAVRGIIRSVAELKGHDPELAEAMVDRRRVYKIGEEIICPEGEVLTLTNVQAERLVGEGDQRRPLLSSGTVKDLDELLLRIGRAESRQITLEPAAVERVARFVENPLISMLLLVVGGLGIYLEVKTPGFGVPGITGICFLAVFFWGHHVAGLAGMEEMVVFVIGAILLLVEIFVIPGFGITGIAGITLMLGALLSAMVPHYPGTPRFAISWPDFETPIMVLSGSVVATSVLALLLGRFLPGTPLFQRLVLAPAGGVTNAAQPSEELVGLEGTTATILRPAGTAMFGERRLNVITRAEFIEQGVPVRIVEVSGNHIVVDKTEDD